MKKWFNKIFRRHRQNKTTAELVPEQWHIVLDIDQLVVYYDNDGICLGQWPLYYFGAKPTSPQNADVYFCGPNCATQYSRSVTTK